MPPPQPYLESRVLAWEQEGRRCTSSTSVGAANRNPGLVAGSDWRLWGNDIRDTHHTGEGTGEGTATGPDHAPCSVFSRFWLTERGALRLDGPTILPGEEAKGAAVSAVAGGERGEAPVLEGVGRFMPGAAGPVKATGGFVHGGAIATMLDSLMGQCNYMHGTAGTYAFVVSATM